MKGKKSCTVVFAGGGTGGHIYPGLAVADELRSLAHENGFAVTICWIGSSRGMDKPLVEKNLDGQGGRSADFFYGVPAGKLRRDFSPGALAANFFDLFKIAGGFFASLAILAKLKPALLFSKGGFVSVPPCLAAKILHIPVYTHECDFTPGLATKLNAKSAKRILLSYRETERYFKPPYRKKCVVTGNPVRSAFYSASAERGKKFLGLAETGSAANRAENRVKNAAKPVLLVIGGSSGALQINNLVKENLAWLCEKFVVVHQTGAANAAEFANLKNENYKPYPFIYAEMCDVIATADIVLSRAGANSLWECAALKKPLLLVPLSGSGTRGDQEENARYFEERGAAVVLSRENANSEKLRAALETLLDKNTRDAMAASCAALMDGVRPARKIAELLLEELGDVSEKAR